MNINTIRENIQRTVGIGQQDRHRLDSMDKFNAGDRWIVEWRGKFKSLAIRTTSNGLGHATIREAIDAFVKRPC